MVKKEKEEIPILKEEAELKRIIAKYAAADKAKKILPSAPGFVTKEFEEFQKEYFAEGQPKTFFEKACRFSSSILKIGVKKEDTEKINNALYYTGLVTKAEEVVSFSILAFLISLIAGAILFFALGRDPVTNSYIGIPYAILAMVLGIIALFGIQKYPFYLQNLATVETLNAMPLAITYMVIYMRSSPTLEGAVRFAAEHLTGPLGRDLRKLVWDFESGIYTSMESALMLYSAKWQSKNQNFSTAIELLCNSMKIPDEHERLKTLDEASHVILKGNFEMMRQFARDLRLPVMILYMLGIVLPVMGLVITPIITTLMMQGLSAKALIVVYNILLPAIIYVMFKIVLSKRPGGFSKPDIEGYPGIPKPGHLMHITKTGNEIQIPLLPISILLFFVISIPGFMLFVSPRPESGFSFIRILQSISFVAGAAVAIILYTLGSSYQKLKVRTEMEALEAGLNAALYALAERISMGAPLENAIGASAENVSGPIKGFFMSVSARMKRLGVPVDQAIFDAENGAIRSYPSQLLRTIMEVIVESTKKGLTAAATSMKTIATFLENFHSIKGSIESAVGKTVTNMRFQAQFLTSFIAGIIIALDILLFRILSELGTRVSTAITLPKDVTISSVTGLFKDSMFNVAKVIPTEYMQIIVGAYMIEVTVLLAMMINGIMNGRDDIYENYLIGSTLIASVVVYLFALIFGVALFAGFKLAA